MKKLFFLSTMALVIAGAVFSGCIQDEVLALTENEQVMLKSAAVAAEYECLPSVYSLVTQRNRQVGQMAVSNDENFLTVEFTGNEWPVKVVQLWVGADPSAVPKTRKYVPVPGKFPYKNAGFTAFQIPLYKLFSLPPGGSYNEKKVYIFAHAEFTDMDTEGGGEASAWSEGTSFGTSRWGSYSTYTVCTQPRGCSPHTALGGDAYIGGVYYYDNTTGGGGAQSIHADNKKIAGTVEYSSGSLSFSLEQEWMFTDLSSEPLVRVYGYSEEPGSGPALVFEGEPTFNQELITIPVAYYNYYKIELNLRECY